jgi:hypothetical protein
LVKIRLFRGSKKNEEVSLGDTSTKKESQEPKEKTIERELTEKRKETPIKEYDETLYTEGYAQKHINSQSGEKPQPHRRISWESAETIEQTIDTMSQEQTEKTSGRTQTGITTEKKVDLIFLRKKNR